MLLSDSGAADEHIDQMHEQENARLQNPLCRAVSRSAKVSIPMLDRKVDTFSGGPMTGKVEQGTHLFGR
jgi:hypothetical protein